MNVFIKGNAMPKILENIKEKAISEARAEMLEEGRQFLPPAAVSCMIEGGNHAQFGNYGPQSGDGEAAISAAEQQSQTEEIILHNILSDN